MSPECEGFSQAIMIGLKVKVKVLLSESESFPRHYSVVDLKDSSKYGEQVQTKEHIFFVVLATMRGCQE